MKIAMSRATSKIKGTPLSETHRVESLDVLRGFALLGILLLNIIGFGLLSPSYNNPGFDLAGSSTVNITTYALVELWAEGAMRGLFSILFGAGVVLFATGERGKGAWLHYKRTFWLLVFGLVNAYILLWNGDILVTYALAGALLFLVRNLNPRALLLSAGVLFVLMSLLHAGMKVGLTEARAASERVADADDPGQVLEQDRQAAISWQEFIADFELDEAEAAKEMVARNSSYRSAFAWNAGKNEEVYLLVLPLFWFWDALAMMLLGMGLYKYGVLQGERSKTFYLKVMVAGFIVGLTINGLDVRDVITSNFDIMQAFGQMQWTYHIGRLGMCLGYIGLLLWCLKAGYLVALKSRLAAVGRMALTNYLLQSVICSLIFTGAGFGLVGTLDRFELYPLVLAIWVLQLWFSPLWLERYQFGPVEWLWRALTYGHTPAMRR